jgi:hypothetical protein
MKMSNSLVSVQASDADYVSLELVSEEITTLRQESENGKQRRLVPGSRVFDLEILDVPKRVCAPVSANDLDMECLLNTRSECIPYPPIGDEVMLDEEYKCEEPDIVKRAQTLVISKWPEMHSVFSKFITLCLDLILFLANVI